MAADVLAATSLVITRDYGREGALSYPFKGNKKAPNDEGPVIDSTPESKRARRRRIARSKGSKP
jgi:hypothetical protein